MANFDHRSRVAVVLVRARNPNNIGAVARAMHDFGFADLRLAGEYPVPLAAARSAVDAGEVLRGARMHEELREAIGDCTLVLGTTAVGERALEHPLATMVEAGARVREHLAGRETHRVALLFGSEKTGLSNAELSYCHGLVTIPMEQYAEVRHPSMNLGQAAAVCLYELVRERTLAEAGSAEVMPAAAEVERLRGLWAEVLESSGYVRRHPANSDAEQVRRLLLRTVPPARDLPVWMGVLRQLLWRLREGGRGEEAATVGRRVMPDAARGDVE